MPNFYRLKQDYLKFEGSERLDLINRLSTNEVNPLKPGQGVKTILTSDKGRFVDLLTLYNFGDFVFASCSFNNSKSVLAHLERYTIMDDFKPYDLSGTHDTILFFGNDSPGTAKEYFSADIKNLENNDFVFFNEGDHHSIVAKNDEPLGGFLFIYSTADRQFWQDNVLSKINAAEISDDEYAQLRIEKGIPEFGKEMSELTNPLECGLNRYVSFTKGCYIGQEVIARLDAYDKISKHMVGIKFVELPPVTNEMKITIDGKECGFVTSIVNTKKFGNIGLGFIKTIFLDYNKEYKIKVKENYFDCFIVKLPFN